MAQLKPNLFASGPIRRQRLNMSATNTPCFCSQVVFDRVACYLYKLARESYKVRQASHSGARRLAVAAPTRRTRKDELEANFGLRPLPSTLASGSPLLSIMCSLLTSSSPCDFGTRCWPSICESIVGTVALNLAQRQRPVIIAVDYPGVPRFIENAQEEHDENKRTGGTP